MPILTGWSNPADAGKLAVMESRALWMMVLGAAWVFAWAGSFSVFAFVEPEGMGFTRGMNRIMAFLGWQGVAGILAFAVLGAGRSWPARHPVRRASLIPVGLAGLLAILLAGLAIWVRFDA